MARHSAICETLPDDGEGDKVTSLFLFDHVRLVCETFWISLSLSTKFGLRPKIGQKVKSFHGGFC